MGSETNDGISLLLLEHDREFLNMPALFPLNTGVLKKIGTSGDTIKAADIFKLLKKSIPAFSAGPPDSLHVVGDVSEQLGAQQLLEFFSWRLSLIE